MLSNPQERFTGRVQSYRRYRPRYPKKIVDLLRRECGLRQDAAVVDVAAGTGLLTEIFLRAGFQVSAVEPNVEMRAVCAELERSYPTLRCVAGTAEETGLADGSADLITVAQAMHWFNLERTRAEFARVLKPGGWCAVIYNNRHMDGDRFNEAYERLLQKFGIDYYSVQRQHMGSERLAQFFGPAEMKCAAFPNSQVLGLEAFEGRILSSSYIPRPGHERFGEMQAAIRRLFEENQSDGVVRIGYECTVCYGRISESSELAS